MGADLEIPKGDFVHLHLHTEYSMLDGLNKISEVVKKVKADGQHAVAMTDHGVMYGVYEFWKGCKAEGVKPIIGCEIYLSPSKRDLREEVDGIKYYHLLLLAKNEVGYHNLIKIVSKAHLEGFYYRPRADRDLLEQHSEGLICTSACAAGPLSRHILRQENTKALDWMKFLHGLYKDDFYLELQRHGFGGTDDFKSLDLKQYNADQIELIKELCTINTQLKTWSKEYDLPLIGTTDAHYLNKEDDIIQEVAFAIKDGKKLEDPSRRMAYNDTYVKTQDELKNTYADVPEVLKNTVAIADKIEIYPIGYDRIQPRFDDVPKGKSTAEYLKELSFEGAKLKYGEITKELEDRINMELEVIHDKGYDDYFLVVSDMMKWAREHEIVVGVRGSVGGSVVAYCLEITNIEPIKWELYFERFLNPERPSPPDIDMDIQDTRREELMNYVKDKYGHDSVAAIAAFGRLKTRAAIRDVSRVMGIDLQLADKLSKMVHVKFGRVKNIDQMIQDDKEFAAVVQSDAKLIQMAEVVTKLQGLCRHVSTHACGHLITPKPIDEYTPLQFETGSTEKVITQLESKPLEELGLMKFDFLGLTNLSIIDNTIRLVKELEGIDIDIYSVPEDDKKTFQLFKDGNTTAVFQFESEGMKKYLRDLQPENLEDLCFMAAAYRPGPMKYIPEYIDCKHGKKKPEYLIPELVPLLQKTYGFAIYQEQVIRIAVDIAGYTMGEADVLRRAMGKKIPEVMKAEEARFIEGCKKRGFSEEIGKKLFEYLMPFADYGFNKAHAAGYAVIGYWTAYLKAHFPIEFMAARLSAVMDAPDKLTVALEEAKHLKIKLLPPDVNYSFAEFRPEGKDAIRFGLNGIKNLGSNVVAEIIQSRADEGEFKSLDEFVHRIKSLNSRGLESLVKVNALHSFGNIGGLLIIYSDVLSARNKMNQAKKKDQIDIFAMLNTGDENTQKIDMKVTPVPNVDNVDSSQRLQWEKELLGIYFTAHPIAAILEKYPDKNFVLLGQNEISEGSSVTGIGVIQRIKNITTKNGDPMAFLTLEDILGSYEGVVFPTDYKTIGEKLAEGGIYLFRGKGNIRNGFKNIIVNNAMPVGEDDTELDEMLNSVKVKKKPLICTLYIHESATRNDLGQLRDILSENTGQINVIIQIADGDEIKRFKVRNLVDETVLKEVVSKLPMVQKVIFK